MEKKETQELNRGLGDIPSPTSAASAPSSLPGSAPVSAPTSDRNDPIDLPFESVFTMNLRTFSRLVASSAWQNISGKSHNHFQEKDTKFNDLHLSNTGSDFPTPKSPTSANRPSQSIPPPAREKGWNEMCIGVWKKSPNNADQDFRGRCVGISIARASTQKEIDELHDRPVSGIRIFILGEELEQDRKREAKLKQTKAQVAEVQKIETKRIDFRETASEVINKQYQFGKRLLQKLYTGETLKKLANSGTNLLTRMVRDIRDKWSGGGQ